ncbi:MAG: hypothetical protein ACT4P1_04975 [Sporichthyaceae bacterium]
MTADKPLDEDDVVAMLRAARTGSEPALRDVTAPAIVAGRRIRRRRQAFGGASAAVLAGAAAIALIAGSPSLGTDDRLVVLPPAGPAATSAPASTGLDEAGAHAINLRVLRAALGPDFQPENPTATPPFQDSLVVTRGSPSAEGLPDGYTARAHVRVSTEPQGEPGCAPDVPGYVCRYRTLADGRVVRFGATGAPLEPSVPVEIRHVFVTQQDGDVVDVSLAVIPDTVDIRTESVPRPTVKAWLASLENALINAASDPEMAPGSVRDRERAAQRVGPSASD